MLDLMPYAHGFLLGVYPFTMLTYYLSPEHLREALAKEAAASDAQGPLVPASTSTAAKATVKSKLLAAGGKIASPTTLHYYNCVSQFSVFCDEDVRPRSCC